MVRRFRCRHFTPLVLFIGVGIFAPWQAAADCSGFQWTAQGPGDQLVALQGFYQATQGQQWLAQAGWNTSASGISSNACSWSGITCCNTTAPADPDQEACTYNGAVQFVTLPYNNLRGTIPASFWAQLGCTLSGISLAGNALSGTIPSSLSAEAPGLQVLLLSNNLMSGTIPADFVNLTKLEQASFSGNQLTGTIPPIFTPASMVHSFDAAHNSLTGTIPELWWTPSHIQYVQLAANKLTGTVPGPDPGPAASFSTTADVHGLQVSFRGNQLTGTLPPGLSVKLMVELDLGSNQLSGNLDSVEEMQYLHILRLDSNNFTGKMPMMSSPFLEVVDLSFNNLSGVLPASLSELSLLSVLLLGGNRFLGGQLTNDFDSLSLLSILDISGSGLQHDVEHPNDAGDFLPDWLHLNRTGPFAPTRILQLMCYSVLAVNGYNPQLTRLFISPSYFHYQGCVCEAGYTIDREDGDVSCRQVAGTNLYYLIFASAILLILLPLITVLAWPQLRARWVTLKDRWFSKSGAPEAGQMMSLVATDVEGSTELWEWNNFVADNAMVVHDETMRSQLGNFGGYEVSTEGDAFVCAFHTAEAAVAWALKTQQALLQAKWPPELEDNPSFCTKVYGEDRQLVPAPLAMRSGRKILFHGLRVRMGIVTGTTSSAIQNMTSKRMEYKGDLVDKLMALSDCGSGGQVIIDGPTLEQLADKTFSIARLVPPIDPHLPADASDPSRPAPVPRSSFVGAATKISHLMRHASNANSTSGDLEGQMADRATSSTPLVSTPSTDRPFQTPAKPAVVLPVVDRILLVDMGVHLVITMKDPETLIQLGVPGLELRMLFHKPLRTLRCVSAGYFEAPAAAISSVAFDRHGASRISGTLETNASMPDVIICFCAIDGLHAMQAANAEVTEGAVKVYLLVLRQLLIITHGYECQQADGCLMLAFSKPLDAAAFCLMAQSCLSAHAWGPMVEGLPGCGPETITSPTRTAVTVSGPRAKMGLVMGQPTRVCPHTTSGRADYFGPLVNRAARICHAAAHGGQVLASEMFMDGLLLDWTGHAEHAPYSRSTSSRLSMSSRERPSFLVSPEPKQHCALHEVSKAWQDCSEQAWSSIASLSAMGNVNGSTPQPGPGHQVELAAIRRSHGDLEMQILPKSLVLSSQDTLHSLLSYQQVLLHHQGDMLFKGVNQRMAIYQLTSPLLWREVSQEATSRKATFLSAGRGLAAVLITSQPASQASSIPASFDSSIPEHEPLPELIAAVRPPAAGDGAGNSSEATPEGGLHGLRARFMSGAINIENDALLPAEDTALSTK